MGSFAHGWRALHSGLGCKWSPGGSCTKLVCGDTVLAPGKAPPHPTEGSPSRRDLKQGLGECSHVAEVGPILQKHGHIFWRKKLFQVTKMYPYLLLDQLAQPFLLLRAPVTLEGDWWKGSAYHICIFASQSLLRSEDLQRAWEAQKHWSGWGQTQTRGQACEQPPCLYFHVWWVQHHLEGVTSRPDCWSKPLQAVLQRSRTGQAAHVWWAQAERQARELGWLQNLTYWLCMALKTVSGKIRLKSAFSVAVCLWKYRFTEWK